MIILTTTHVILNMKYSLNEIISRMKTTSKGVYKLGRRSIEIIYFKNRDKNIGKSMNKVSGI